MRVLIREKLQYMDCFPPDTFERALVQGRGVCLCWAKLKSNVKDIRAQEVLVRVGFGLWVDACTWVKVEFRA